MTIPVRAGHRAALPVALAAAIALASCSTPSTLTVSLLTPQGRDPLAHAATVRVTAVGPNPPVVVTSKLGPGEALDLALPSLPAGSDVSLLIEALDATGAVVARGRSPEVVLQAADLALGVYVGVPGSIGLAPASPLPSGRDQVAAATATGYGTLLFGGADASGNLLSDILLYDDYFHTLDQGTALPAGRAGEAAVALADGPVVLFGGTGSAGPIAELAELDPSASPAGSLQSAPIAATAARTGSAMVSLGSGATGGEVLLVAGGTTSAGPTDAAGLVETFPQLSYAPLPKGLTATRGAGIVAVAAAGADGAGALITGGGATAPIAEWFDLARGTFTPITVPATVGAQNGEAATVLPSGAILVAGGSVAGAPTAGGWLYAPQTGTVTPIPGLLKYPRTGLTLTAVAGDVLAEGGVGTDGTPRKDAEVLDAKTLDRVAVLPLAEPRSGGVAAVLETGDVLLAAGSAGAGAKNDAIEIYTPR